MKKLILLSTFVFLTACNDKATSNQTEAPTNQNPFNGHWRVEVNSPTPIPGWARSYCDNSSGSWLCDFDPNPPTACDSVRYQGYGVVGTEFWIDGDTIKIGGLNPEPLAYSPEGVSPGAGETWWNLSFLGNDLVVTYEDGCSLKFTEVE